MTKFLYSSFIVLCACSLPSCITIENPYPSLAPGRWQGVLKLDPVPVTADVVESEGRARFEEVTEGQLPFLFDVVYDTDTSFYIEIINGTERIRVDQIQTGVNRATAKDSIRIDFPLYESYIIALFEEDVIEGQWVVTTRDNYRVPFVAWYGRDYRFTNLRKAPVADLSGRWEATFDLESKSPFKGIGEFEQDGNHLTGTFLTETGDYRFLEGTVQADKLYLSAFDGAHAFLFEGKVLEDGSLIGTFRSGTHYQTTWEARRNPDFELADPDSLTFLTDPAQPLSFQFPNQDGELVAFDGPKLAGKVRIVQIMGTWCPNCRDETDFLREYLAENPNPDLAVVGLAFEKHRDREQSLAIIHRYHERLELPYDLLWAGYYQKEEAAKALPMLNQILSYPTMIFVDRSGRVRRIHTGFSGPATSKYEAFKADFEEYVQQLLFEKTTTF